MSADQVDPETEGFDDNPREICEGHTSNNDVDDNLEDGELEDGEIDDDNTETPSNNLNDNVQQKTEEKEEYKEETESKSKSSSRDKKKRKRRRDDDSRKRGKKKRYDHINENDEEQQWLNEQHHGGHKSKRYKDHDVVGSQSPNQDIYDSPYDSPPGLYDSPSDGDGDDRIGEPTSMLGLVQDDFMDVSISAQERQTGDSEKREKRSRKNKYKSRSSDGVKHSSSRKTPLIDLPRSERPHCKFFKEGKCSKGSNCPFNHDFQPERKLDVCKFYLTGNCNRENCIFMHNEFPCKYFHTGKDCYSGDNCKFSHGPMTEEMEEYFERVLEEESHQRKPSLLGSPPRHVVEEAERMKERIEHVKRIPSIFDIETFPPGHSPKKSPQKNISPARPTGFYNENGPPQGPMNNQAPPQGPPVDNIGSSVNSMGPVNNMGPPVNDMGPPMNNFGQPMNNFGPPMNNNLGPPPMNNLGSHPMNSLGPRMNCPPPGFPGGPEIPPNQGVAPGSVLNMIGAILRTAAPLIVNQRSGQSLGHTMGMTNGPNINEPPMMIMDNEQNHPNDGNMLKPNYYRQESDDSNPEISVIKVIESKDVLTEKMNEHQNEKLSKSPQNKPPLDPRARMRLAARNDLGSEPLPVSSSSSKTSSDEDHRLREDEEIKSSEEEEKLATQPEVNFGPKFEFSKDDNWYSSDEDNDDENKLVISQQKSSSTPVPSLSKTSTINIMEMISNVKNDKSLQSSSESKNQKGDVNQPSFYSPSMTLSQSYSVKCSKEVNVPITHCVLTTMLYRIKTFTLLHQDKPYDKIPTNVDPIDSRYQSDPRVQKYCQRLARKTALPVNTVVNVEKKVDHIQLPDLNLNSDGTINVSKVRTLDPRMSRNSSSDELKPQQPAPRTRSDPRMLRNISNEDQKSQHVDPRVSRSISNEDQKVKPFDTRMSKNSNLDDRKTNIDPRMSRKSSTEEQKQPHSDPRMSWKTSSDVQISLNNDPRMSRKISTDEQKPLYQDPRLRQSQNSGDSASTLRNTLGSVFSDIQSGFQRPSVPRSDPRIARSISMEGGVPNIQQFSLEKSKSNELKLGNFSSY